jgi:hypothetical protein
MDVKLYARVAWRFKWLLLLTFVIAIPASVLATKKVSFADGHLKLTPRGAQVWQSSSVILVTQQGFPWGRSVFPILPAPDGKAITPTYADPTRFSGLALLYVQLANGTQFRRLLGRLPGKLNAVPILPSADASVSQALPLIEFDATSGAPEVATGIADRAASTFEKFLTKKQNAAGIPSSQRVDVEPVTTHAPAKLTTPAKKTVPILIFVILMAGGFGLALALENARPRMPIRDSATTVRPPEVARELSAVRDSARADTQNARSRSA